MAKMAMPWQGHPARAGEGKPSPHRLRKKIKNTTNEPTMLLKTNEGDFRSHDVIEITWLMAFCHDLYENHRLNYFSEVERRQRKRGIYDQKNCQCGGTSNRRLELSPHPEGAGAARLWHGLPGHVRSKADCTGWKPYHGFTAGLANVQNR
jgi:hypothetical protein